MHDRTAPLDSVVQDWVAALPWKQQSILFSGLRGPDVGNVPNIKAVNRWMRTVSQYNADPSKNYMRRAERPSAMSVCEELEFLAVHYVHHFADALAVIAYGHSEEFEAEYAARLHYTIAEELFHFAPEHPAVFALRHRDKREGHDAAEADWATTQREALQDYLTAVWAVRLHAA